MVIIWEIITKAQANLVISSSAIKPFILGLEILAKKGGDIKKHLSLKENKFTRIAILKEGNCLNLLKIINSKYKYLEAGDFVKKEIFFLDIISEYFGWIVIYIEENIQIVYSKNAVITKIPTSSHEFVFLGILTVLATQNPKQPYEACCTASYVFKTALFELITDKKYQITNNQIIKNISKSLKNIENKL